VEQKGWNVAYFTGTYFIKVWNEVRKMSHCSKNDVDVIKRSRSIQKQQEA